MESMGLDSRLGAGQRALSTSVVVIVRNRAVHRHDRVHLGLRDGPAHMKVLLGGEQDAHGLVLVDEGVVHAPVGEAVEDESDVEFGAAVSAKLFWEAELDGFEHDSVDAALEPGGVPFA